MIRKLLKKNKIIITDGAMGTYYSSLTGRDSTFSELANKSQPQIIKKIHKQYLDAGSMLIRTNTFSANTISLNINKKKLKEIIDNGYKIAEEVLKDKKACLAADIGPIPEVKEGKEIDENLILAEYKFIIDVFYQSGARIFLFETFSDRKYLDKLASYIKNKNKNNYIIAQFTFNETGFTRKGISARRLLSSINKNKNFDACGLNCGVGPAHLKNIISQLEFKDSILTALPNAGYPEVVNQRTVYTKNADYFAGVMIDIKNMGARIIGGCCGTTPFHIEKIVEKLKQDKNKKRKKTIKRKNENVSWETKYEKATNKFQEKLEKKKKIVAVELDPPFDIDIDSFLEGARSLKNNGTDIITIADSPLGRERIDSIMISAKIKREIGIETLPHLACRDSNIIGLKSRLMAAYVEGIRNLLLVTGDPIASSDRNEIKSVFDLNSFKLMELVQQMNSDKFSKDAFFYGGALNINSHNPEKEIKRMERKIEKGASFFLTQPVFEKKAVQFLKKISDYEHIYILGGIMPLVSYNNARFLNNEVPGIKIPEKQVNKFTKNMSRKKAEETGIDIALELAQQIEKLVDGYYFIVPFGRVQIINKIINMLF